MKTSYNWLQQYVDIPWDAHALAQRLTMVGLAVEDVRMIGAFPDSVVVAQIRSRQPHPNADRLSVCEVDDGSGQALRIVCGAPNCDAGRKVALARIGTELGPTLTIQPCTIRGVSSAGMLCSERELGLSDSHAGILILPDDAAVGSPLRAHLETDYVIDWEVTPNRPDWLSHLGIAREIAATSGGTLRYPPAELTTAPGTDAQREFSVRVLVPDLCPRYTARIIRGVTIGPSPDWLQRRLKAVGLRLINNVVDITNYVLLECGQPLHAFDLRLLAGQTLIVRAAHAGETLPTLDNRTHSLSENHVVIADAGKSLALGGIIGGANSEISPATTDILLESACFYAPNIRATAKQLGISTDSSYRFERGVDIDMVEFASARAAHLICQYAGGRLMAGLIDVRQPAQASVEVPCRYSRINHLLGAEFDHRQVHTILGRLGLTHGDDSGERATWKIPSYRQDLTREVDLIEEIARIHGVNEIEPSQTMAISTSDGLQDAYQPIQTAREQLLALGLVECMSYTMTSPAEASLDQRFAAEQFVALKNPLSADLSVLRAGLVGSMIRTVAHNIAHGNQDLRLFELGRVFCQSADSPEEHHELCVALTGHKKPERFSEERQERFDFADLRGILEDWMELRGVDSFDAIPGSSPLFADGVGANIIVNGTLAGALGEIRGELVKDIRIKHPLFIAVADLDVILGLPANPVQYRMPAQFPAVSRDVVFAADERLEHRQVTQAIRAAGADFLEAIELVEIYRDEKIIGAGRKSMAYTVTYRCADRTLTDQEVNDSQEKIRVFLANELPVQIR